MPVPAPLAERLKEAVRSVRDFPRRGILFWDVTTVLSDPGAFRDSVEALTEPFKGDHVEIVVGVESRGFVLGGAVALMLHAGFVPVRKAGRLPSDTISAAYALEYGEAVLEMHSDAIAPRQRVLIVDDLLATGGTAAATVQLVEQLGGVVVGLAFLIELPDLGGGSAIGAHRRVSLVNL